MIYALIVLSTVCAVFGLVQWYVASDLRKRLTEAIIEAQEYHKLAVTAEAELVASKETLAEHKDHIGQLIDDLRKRH
jgi:hypothetical protein